MNGIMTGLNYQSVEFLLTLYGTRKKRALFEGLQEIERGVLEAQARHLERKGAGVSGSKL